MKHHNWLHVDASNGLPFDDGSFDAVYSNNMLECVSDKETFIREMHRVLKPAGQIVCAHYDFDSQAIDGDDKDLVRKVIHAYSDWQQAWMNDSDAWMGRRLWRTFQRTRLFRGSVQAFVLTETDFAPGTYGHSTITATDALVRRNLITEQECNDFLGSIQRLAQSGEYFYSATSYVYRGVKVQKQGSDPKSFIGAT